MNHPAANNNDLFELISASAISYTEKTDVFIKS